MDQLDELIINALSEVQDNYYSTVYKNIDAFKSALIGRSGLYNNGSFERYGERVFCYELYYQLRLKINALNEINPSLINGATLQGEVHKMDISALYESFNIESPDNDIIPDFLLHVPFNADAQILAIEVKCINNLTSVALEQDLSKLNTLVTKLNYRKGYFITVNSELDYIKSLLKRIDVFKFKGGSKIKVIWKKNNDTKIAIWNLREPNNLEFL